MFPLNLLPMFLHMYILWTWHLWYLCILPTYMYQCRHWWCHSPFHHLLSPCFCAFMFLLNSWFWSSTFLNFVLPLESISWRFSCNLPFIFQCCLHLISSSLDLGLWFLWIFLLVNKQIFKNLCQYQGQWTYVLLVPLILLDILIPLI